MPAIDWSPHWSAAFPTSGWTQASSWCEHSLASSISFIGIWQPILPKYLWDMGIAVFTLQGVHLLVAYQLLKNITHIISSWNWLWVFRYFAEIVTHFLYFCSTAEEPKTASNWGVFVSIEIQYWQAKGGVVGARSCKKERASKIPSYVMQVQEVAWTHKRTWFQGYICLPW